MIDRRYQLSLLGAAFALATANAQQRASDAIPLRQLGPVVAGGTENIGTGVVLRAMSDGRIILVSRGRSRAYLMDSALRVVSVIRDSTTGTGTQGLIAGLVPYHGDSTLMPDRVCILQRA